MSPVVKVLINHIDCCGKISLILDIEHILLNDHDQTNTVKFISCVRESTDAFDGGANLTLTFTQMIYYIFFSWYCSFRSSFTYILLCSFQISLSILVTATSVLFSLVWGIGVSGMLSTSIFNVSINFLTLDLKFVLTYLKIFLSVFGYWSACMNNVLSNRCPHMASVLLKNLFVVFFNCWFLFWLLLLPVFPVSGLTSGLDFGCSDLTFVSYIFMPNETLKDN